MKTNKVIQFAFCTTLLAGLMSCGSDEPSSVSADDAKAAFNSANQNLANEFGAIFESEGFQAMSALGSVSGSGEPLPFGRVSSYKRDGAKDQIKASLYAFRTIVLNTAAANAKVSGDEPFDYNTNKGVYEWNSETQVFDKTGEENIIKILFPSVEGSSVNDAEFQLAGYAEEATPNGDDAYSPTFIDASLLVDGEVVAELDLDVEYGSDDQPVFADITYFLTPYSFEVKFDDKASTSTSGSETLSKNGDVLVGVSLDVTFKTSAKLEEEVEKVTGTLQLMDIKFVVTVDASDIANANDYNDIIDIKIKVDGRSAGSIVIDQGPDGEPLPIVEYNDGSTDTLESLFQDLAVQLENLALELEG